MFNILLSILSEYLAEYPIININYRRYFLKSQENLCTWATVL